MSIAGGPYVIRDSSLVLELDAADRNSYVSGSTTWFDLSAINSTGSLTNGPTFNSASGGNIVLDGVDDYVKISNPPNIATGNYNFSAWIKTTYFSAYQQIASSWTGGGNGVHFAAINTSQKLYGFAGSEVNTNSKNLCDGLWHQVSISRRGTLGDFYVDGLFVQTSTLGGNNASLGDAKIGLRGDNGGQYFRGNISCVLIYSRDLSASEILQNYNAQKGRFGLT